MEFSIIHSIMITVITILIFSTYSSAYWLIPPYGQPPIPGSNVSKTCNDWIKHYGFGDNTMLNRVMAGSRAQQYDIYVSVWAVIYAQVLLAFPVIGVYNNDNYVYTPIRYCWQHQMPQYDEELTSWTFESFATTSKSCEEWIHLYSYYINYRYKENWNHANDRKRYEDDNISVWAAGYARFITKRKHKDTIAPNEYCAGMGLSDTHEMNFMSFNVTIKSCREWIEMSEYGNNSDVNRQKFYEQRENYQRFKKYINAWTILYFKHLRTYYDPNKTAFGCASSSTSEPDREPLTPAEFCDSEGLNEEVPLSYFHRIIVDENIE